MHFNPQRARELLRIGAGLPDAQFRDGQAEAIREVITGARRILVVQKTGWGKSFVYFIATKLLREAGHGPALLISPLLALMRNQIAAAERMGLRATTINSDNTNHWEEIEQEVLNDTVDILLISPERLANERFQTQVLARVASRIGLLVIDEAHCISDWGHDFRPHYRLIERILRNLPQNMRLLATTATANERVVTDLTKVLGANLHISRGDLHRPSLALQTIRLPSQPERMAWLAEQIPTMPGSGIIYALTVRDANLVAEWLQSRGLQVHAYTGQSGPQRPELEQALLENRVKALVATNALGMGFDKPDLGFVVHFQAPGSVVAYYQQVGRAGRALDAAYGILLSGMEDLEITDYFIDTAFPTRREVTAVIDALHRAPEGLSVPELEGKINVSRGRIVKTIELLALESPAPLAKQKAKWQLTASTLSEHFWERAERLTELRRFEQQQMQEYVRLESGHMDFLIRALDGAPNTTVPPNLPPLPATPSPHTILAALKFLRRSSVSIEPRQLWPAGGLSQYGVAGRIKEEVRAQPGKALCCWGDAGWGELVRDGKHQGHYPDDLVRACVSLVEEWAPKPAPQWVTCIPSMRHPELVPDFAARLAAALGLPFLPILVKLHDTPEQKKMENSAQQARNLDGSFGISGASPPKGAVLLIDDIVDSCWTLTVAAWLLRSNGSGEVWPLVLAKSGPGE